ncbi:hypothetical protein OG874_22585 [Nocardia sp. NBC_00565]|uniref:hypothetical protein n=1 Tax=Nocardia sp. NBC_00565 TaxID=2975993 RepID=UPI002E80F49D|nr:hypothetical protein [Nocardia sp. NBC_00565]WUC07705.1 hypothetical protein OG874_22585 [Nocardia sp. NBC_00565]
MSVLFFVTILQILFIPMVRKLNGNLHTSSDWVTNRTGLWIQKGGAKGGSGSGGGGTALGMGQTGAGHKMSGLGMMALMGGMSTIANSPLTEWMMGGLPGSIHPQSKLKKATAAAQGGVWGDEWFGPAYSQSYMNRPLFVEGVRRALRGAREHGGRIDNALGASAGVQGTLDAGGSIADSFGAMQGAGFKNKQRMFLAARSRNIVASAADDEQLADKDLSLVAAAVKRAQLQGRRLMDGRGDVDEAAADFATLQQSAFVLRRTKSGGVTLDGGRTARGLPMGDEEFYVRDYMANATSDKMHALQALADGQDLTQMVANGNNSAAWLQNHGIDRTAASRMRQWIGNEHAMRIEKETMKLMENVTDGEQMRIVRGEIAAAVDTDHWASGVQGTPWNSVAPPGSAHADTRWGGALQGVARQLRR